MHRRVADGIFCFLFLFIEGIKLQGPHLNGLFGSGPDFEDLGMWNGTDRAITSCVYIHKI